MLEAILDLTTQLYAADSMLFRGWQRPRKNVSQARDIKLVTF
jgi:hypothetical protein